MEYPIFQVDAFTGELFQGNPAAVVLLPQWLPDATMQAVAAENNLAETAFVVTGGKRFPLRWFTPEVEIDLCGHATLATAHVLFAEGLAPGNRVVFNSASGELGVDRLRELLALDFPARPATRVEPAGELLDALEGALGRRPLEVFKARDVMAVYGLEEEIRALKPDFAALARVDALGIIVTAPGLECDFVSRFFAPRAGISEDPVTGSAHCTLVPYWSHLLGMQALRALQVSARGGELFCEDHGERVRIAGRAVEYLAGKIML